MQLSHPLAGELAEDGGYVTGILGHDFANTFLDTRRYATRHTRHDLLQFQQWQRGIP